jgi:arylamine N-acetyltransferase
MTDRCGHVTSGVQVDAASAWVDRYLAVIGASREAPSVGALGRLIRAHIAAVPFENVASILRRRDHPGDGPVPPLDLDATLATWEARANGGVCFDVTAMMLRLLTALGYSPAPVLGRIGEPGPGFWLGRHQALVVTIRGDRYLVDAGNGAPFYDPIPLDGPSEFHLAGLGFRFRADEQSGIWTQDRLLNGVWTPFCRYDLRPAEQSARRAAYQKHHRVTESWVASSLFMAHVGETAVHSVRNAEVTRYDQDGKHTWELTSDADAERLADEVFKLPGLRIAEARQALARLATAAAPAT